MTYMKVAIAQWASPSDEAPEARVARYTALQAELRGADLVILPELWYPGYFAFDRYEELAQDLKGPLVTTMSQWARELGAYLHGGSVLERDAAGELHNTAVLFAPDGTLVHTYRKAHLLGISSREAELLTAGDAVGTATTPFGTLGSAVCFDLRFPELFRMLRDAGAGIVVLAAAWPAARTEHWRLLTRARALENQMFLIGCAAAGEQGGVDLSGHSVVVDPWGRVLAEAGPGQSVLRAEIDPALVDQMRAEFPVLASRRFGRPERVRA